MELFNRFDLEKQIEVSDELIAQAHQLILEGNFERAEEVLIDIINNMINGNFGYRKDDVRELYSLMLASRITQYDSAANSQAAFSDAECTEEQKAEKDRLIEQLQQCIDDKNWEKGIEILDKIEVECVRNYRVQETENLCRSCHEGHWMSLTDLSNIRYPKMYQRLKDEQLEKLRKLMADGKKDEALNLCIYIGANYFSPYNKEEENKLRTVLMVLYVDENWQENYVMLEESIEKTPLNGLDSIYKTEALERLEKLVNSGKISKKAYTCFKNDILCGSIIDSDDEPILIELAENSNLYMLAKLIEEYFDCIVYHIVNNGLATYLLTVSKDPDRWEEERPAGDTATVLILNSDINDSCYERVNIFNNNGALGVEEFWLKELLSEIAETADNAQE